MKPMERPILFSAPMVRAILAGTKTQTRRIVKPQPPADCTTVYRPFAQEPNNWQGACADDLIGWYGKCPYGVPGDRLWGRESWQAWTEFNNVPPREVPPTSRVNYLADGNVWDAKKRPSMFMPRWASRITLEVTGARCERLQDISEADAIAEGAFQENGGWWGFDIDGETGDGTPQEAYSSLWDTINGNGSWEANPWVWCVEFRMIPPPTEIEAGQSPAGEGRG